MSELKLVSPLLDGFLVGNPISEHDGVHCYPAMKENSDQKYIVKVISVPASQVQLEALLLTGAHKDPSEAMDYFKAEADRIVEEACTLKTMSKLEGFLPFDKWQVVPMEDGKLGYEVYLLSSYKRSLEKYARKNGITHLEAINLALDMCQALAICRKSGFLYVDLKPSNIFISKEKGYRIGDLGLIPMSSLAYTTLPAKYRSAYVPPEAHDDLKALNQTIDTYSLGMLLYQIYNDSSLPENIQDSIQEIPSPANADYELAEIIMKAIHRDPEQRWPGPMEMGQALVSYMQRNSVNNTPIAAPRLDITEAETIVLPNVRDLTENLRSSAMQEETVPAENTVSPEVNSTDETPAPILSDESAPEALAPESAVSPEHTVEAATPTKSDPVPVIAEEEIDFRDFLEPEDFTVSSESKHKETAVPSRTTTAVQTREEKTVRKPIGKSVIAGLVILVVLGILGACAFFFYHNYYLLPIDNLVVDGTQDQLTVSVSCDFDDSILTVRCSDSYGNGTTKSLTDGKAVFDSLLPDSLYRIELQASGFHKLVGKTSEIFNTDALTNVVTFTSAIGPTDGSVVISFTSEGPEPSEWVLSWITEGEELQSQSFSGHTLTVRGLTLGKLYSFTLSGSEGAEITGITELEYQVAQTVIAENLRVVSFVDGTLRVEWDAPADAQVSGWTVRCYDDNGFESSQDTTENSAVFQELNSTAGYTVEVLASGMTQPARVSVTPNPINITGISFDDEESESLTIQWEFTGDAPDGGWYLMYSIDNSLIQNIVKSDTASVTIQPKVFGATYSFEIQAADSTSIFNNRGEYTCSHADVYVKHGLSAEKITAHLLKTPSGEWYYDQLDKDIYTEVFAPGDAISMVLKASVNFYLDKEELNVLYVIRDENGKVLPEYISQEKLEWNDLWFAGDYHASELNIPKVPDKAGSYSISVYFNGLAITSTNFTISE